LPGRRGRSTDVNSLIAQASQWLTAHMTASARFITVHFRRV
jgi:hypothetical protein